MVFGMVCRRGGIFGPSSPVQQTPRCDRSTSPDQPSLPPPRIRRRVCSGFARPTPDRRDPTDRVCPGFDRRPTADHVPMACREGGVVAGRQLDRQVMLGGVIPSMILVMKMHESLAI